jgi:hypothetical protein
LEIFERLTDSDPLNTGWQFGVGAGLLQVGELLEAHGDVTGASERYVRALPIFEGLAKADPHRTDWQHALSASLDKAGDVVAVRGDADGAVDCYTRALQIIESLTGSGPRNVGVQVGQAVRHFKIAIVLESADGDSASGHWAEAHRMFSMVDADGQLPESMRKFLDHVTTKLGPT